MRRVKGERVGGFYLKVRPALFYFALFSYTKVLCEEVLSKVKKQSDTDPEVSNARYRYLEAKIRLGKENAEGFVIS